MSVKKKRAFERRDPCSPLLRLGVALTMARLENHSGIIEVRDKEASHEIAVTEGGVCSVDGCDKESVIERIPSMFSLVRPNVIWKERSVESSLCYDPAPLVFTGVTQRKDLFDPRALIERIPVQTLEVGRDALNRLKQLPLSKEQFEFLCRLGRPTPVSMVLWKRGLSPDEAASLLIALNLLGLWRERWRPGHLPRPTPAWTVLKKAQSSPDDYELLNIDGDADLELINKAFRHLSLELHPDRVTGKSEDEKKAAKEAFGIVTDAYSRLRKRHGSRRKRSVAGQKPHSEWPRVFNRIQKARKEGDTALARKLALNCLAVPGLPVHVKGRLKAILTSAA